MSYRWLLLATNWWEKLRAMPEHRLARQAWMEEIRLMLSGCDTCWCFKLLHALERVGLVGPQQWRVGSQGGTSDAVQALEFARTDVLTALLRAQRERWAGIVGVSANPRTGPSEGTHLRTHVSWVHTLENGVDQTRRNAPKYLKLCMSLPKLQCLARYRLGGQHLEGRRAGRSMRGTPSRACKLCSRESSNGVWRSRMISRCGSGWDEDLLHFMLECPAYDHIREDHPSLFAHGSLPAGDRLLQVFNHDDQARLADCVWQMNLYRAELLGLTRPIDAYVYRQPRNYVPSDPALRCAADGDSVQSPLHWGQYREHIYMLALIVVTAGMLWGCLILFSSILAMRHSHASD